MGEYESKPKPKAPVQGQQPTPAPAPKPKPKKSTERIAAFPTRLDLPEQIVDSSRVFPLVKPKMNKEDEYLVKATVSIDPVVAQVSRGKADELVDRGREKQRAEAFSPLDNEHILDNSTPIPIRFWPKRVGDHEADVRVMLRSEDDVELRSIRVYGHARRLEDAPAQPIDALDASEYRDPKVPMANLDKVSRTDQGALENATKHGVRAAGNLARHQNRGLQTAKENARAYSRKPPETTMWDWMAELAITMAVGGVASIVSKAVAGKFGPKLERLPLIRRIKNDEKRKKFTQDTLGDAVKDGFKNAARGPAVSAALNRATTKHEPDGRSRSSNGEIDFFTRQHEALDALANENEKFVLRQHELLQHSLATAPEHAVAAMEAMHEAFDEKAAVVPRQQQIESELQWLNLIGRSENGSENVTVNGGKREVTKLQRATGATRGVLRIRVIDSQVKGASIDGISQEIADDLRTLLLRDRGIPIVIVFGEPPIFITRDEVGRVRLPFYRQETEVAQHHEAQAIVDRVLSKPLSEWGVKKIETDDGTGRGG